MTAALYAGTEQSKVALLERGIYGGQMNNTAEIENYRVTTIYQVPPWRKRCLSLWKNLEWIIFLEP